MWCCYAIFFIGNVIDRVIPPTCLFVSFKRDAKAMRTYSSMFVTMVMDLFIAALNQIFNSTRIIYVYEIAIKS